MSRFALELIRRRGDKQWTQQDLCNASGVSRATIALYESGRRKPKYQSVAKLAQGLGCTVPEIFPDFEDELQTDTDRFRVMQAQVERLERELARGGSPEPPQHITAEPPTGSPEAAYVADMWDELPTSLRRQILAEIVQNRYAEDNANAKDSGN